MRVDVKLYKDCMKTYALVMPIYFFVQFPAQTSDDIDNFFKKPIELCQLFLEFSGKKSSAKVPSVTVSLYNVTILC